MELFVLFVLISNFVTRNTMHNGATCELGAA